MTHEDALRLIRQQYAAVHGADPVISYQDLFVEKNADRVSAVCGYRRASAGKLFLEAYLDKPVEDVLEAALGRKFLRHDIVEIGSLAAETAPAMIALWSRAANELAYKAEVAVAVLTSPLRRMFGRIGLSLKEIEPASGERLDAGAQRWGRYYAQDPFICAGFIAEGQQKLARFTDRKLSRCA